MFLLFINIVKVLAQREDKSDKWFFRKAVAATVPSNRLGMDLRKPHGLRLRKNDPCRSSAM